MSDEQNNSPNPPPVVVNIINSNEGSENVSELAEQLGEQIEQIGSAEPDALGADTVVVVSEPDTGADNEPIADAIAGASDNAVEIARIGAERDIAIAAIEAEAGNSNGNAPPTQWLEELEQCRTAITKLEETIAEMQNSLIPPPQSEVDLSEIVTEEAEPDQLETAPEPNSIPPNTPVPTLEIGTELSAVEKAVEGDLAKLKPPFIPI